jgi:hypothetical protein
MGAVRYGTCAQLEEMATQMILDSLEGVTSRDAKSDILTPWKEKHRALHEIKTRSGAPVDPQVLRGQFTKAYNPEKPHLNSREGAAAAPRASATWDPDDAAPTGMLSPEFAAVIGMERID